MIIWRENLRLGAYNIDQWFFILNIQVGAISSIKLVFTVTLYCNTNCCLPTQILAFLAMLTLLNDYKNTVVFV